MSQYDLNLKVKSDISLFDQLNCKRTRLIYPNKKLPPVNHITDLVFFTEIHMQV